MRTGCVSVREEGSETEAHPGWPRGRRRGCGSDPGADRNQRPGSSPPRQECSRGRRRRRSSDGPGDGRPPLDEEPGYPTSIPEGAAYYIVVRGDTLWDISARFLKNPYLWPQIWDAEQVHQGRPLDLPGRPVVLPKVAARRRGRGPGAAAEPGPEGVAEGAGDPRHGRGRGRGRRDGARPRDRRALAAVRRLRRQRARGREPVPRRLRAGLRQARVRRPRHRLPQQGQQRRREGGRPLHAAPRRLHA